MNASSRIAQLWHYPVKAMLGERRPSLRLDSRGVTGDRGLALRTADGGLGSLKHARRHRRIDGLFDFHARERDGTVEIRFPDGRWWRADEPGLDAALSATLGQPLALCAEAEVRHLDDSPLHILTTAALDHLQSLLPDLHIDARRFRPNLVLAGAGAGFAEFDWIGRTLRIGEQVRLKISKTTERCRMTTLAQDELPDEPRILRGVARHAGLQFGVYAEVLATGTIHEGDAVAIEA